MKRHLLIVGAVAALLTGACSSSTPAADGSDPVTTTTGADPGTLQPPPPRVPREPAKMPSLRGLYLPPEVAAVGGQLSALLLTDLPCDDLVLILGSGEWTVEATTVLPAMEAIPDVGFPGSGEVTYVVLAGPGGDQAFGPVEPTTGGGCRADLARLPVSPITVAGFIDLATEASALQLSCGIDGGVADLTVGYVMEEMIVGVSLQFPTAAGTHQLTEPPSVEITTPGATIEALITQLGGAATDSDRSESTLDAGEGWSGTVTVSGDKTFQLDFALSGLTGPDGTETAVSGSTSCDPEASLPLPALSR